ncbi:MAG: hypothetical protein GX774_09840 [Armatimonadetes bacterium]|jgi:hypothetical protein|nr:hypothetical protein [Armatimonadota bacterium]
MDVSRSVRRLQSISVGLRWVAWIVLVVAVIAAITGAQAISFVPVDVDSVSSILARLPILGGATTGILVFLAGLVQWVVLLALAEGIQVFLAIEENTRSISTPKAAAANEKTPAGVA